VIQNSTQKIKSVFIQFLECVKSKSFVLPQRPELDKYATISLQCLDMLPKILLYSLKLLDDFAIRFSLSSSDGQNKLSWLETKLKNILRNRKEFIRVQRGTFEIKSEYRV